MAESTDEQFRDRLRDLDEDEDSDVTSWEADFLETVLFKWSGALTEKQRTAAAKILQRYDF